MPRELWDMHKAAYEAGFMQGYYCALADVEEELRERNNEDGVKTIKEIRKFNDESEKKSKEKENDSQI